MCTFLGRKIHAFHQIRRRWMKVENQSLKRGFSALAPLLLEIQQQPFPVAPQGHDYQRCSQILPDVPGSQDRSSVGGGALLNSAGPAFCGHDQEAARRPPGHRGHLPLPLERPVGTPGCAAPGQSGPPAPRRRGVCVLAFDPSLEVYCGEDPPD